MLNTTVVQLKVANGIIIGLTRPLPAGELVIPELIDGEQITGIGTDVFKNTALSAVTLPASLTTIGAGAFENTALTSIVIPSTVTRIDGNAFAKNSKLATVRVLSETPYTIAGGVFSACPSLTIIEVPAKKGDTYRRGPEGWSEWKDYIRGSGEYAILVETSEFGSISVQSNTASVGESVAVQVVPIAEMQVEHLQYKTADGTDQQISANSFTMPASNITVSAKFTPRTDGISFTAGSEEHGRIETVKKGSTISLEIAPFMGYSIESVSAVSDGNPVAIAQKDSSTYTFTAGPKGTEVTVKWFQKTFRVTFDYGEAISVRYGEAMKSPSSEPTKAGCIFDGYYEKLEKSIIVESLNAQKVSSYRLYGRKIYFIHRWR